jgi:hypothetical protein
MIPGTIFLSADECLGNPESLRLKLVNVDKNNVNIILKLI